MHSHESTFGQAISVSGACATEVSVSMLSRHAGNWKLIVRYEKFDAFMAAIPVVSYHVLVYGGDPT